MKFYFAVKNNSISQEHAFTTLSPHSLIEKLNHHHHHHHRNMSSQVNSDIPPSSTPVVMLSAPDTQDNPQEAFHTPPEQASLHSSDVNVVRHSAGSQVLDDPSDHSVFLDEIRKFHDDFQLGFGEDFLPVNDDDSCKDIPMDKNSVPEKNAVNDDDFLLFCREIDRFSSYQVGEGSGYVNGDNRSSVEVGEVSDLRQGPVLDLLPDSIRSRLEKVVAGVSHERIKRFTMFEVLKALKKKLTLLETAKRSGFAFPESDPFFEGIDGSFMNE
ncbi:hypothetical protein MtrunA17_Chr7g0227161 [Medicago truncatula]|uniref:Uncharacterized protein n=1 Tax=Medicago truncatula TaxID=3880 RepID=A0A396H1Z4_MEDTR|nr:hypothetical protein MtrunA17_Chr7g0227161 [Medicago truncatula]